MMTGLASRGPTYPTMPHICSTPSPRAVAACSRLTRAGERIRTSEVVAPVGSQGKPNEPPVGRCRGVRYACGEIAHGRIEASRGVRVTAPVDAVELWVTDPDAVRAPALLARYEELLS